MDETRENDLHFALRVLSERRKNPVYNTMTASSDPDQAVAYFVNRFGHEPDEVFVDSGLLWCGPVEVTK